MRLIKVARGAFRNLIVFYKDACGLLRFYSEQAGACGQLCILAATLYAPCKHTRFE